MIKPIFLVKSLSHLALVAVIMIVPGVDPLGAQDPPEVQESTIAAQFFDQVVALSFAGTSPLAPAGRDSVIVEAGQANGKGSINIKSLNACEMSSDRPCWAISLSAPTDEASEITDFTDLDGLAKDLAVGFSMRWVREPDLANFKGVGELCDRFWASPGYSDADCDSDSPILQEWIHREALAAVSSSQEDIREAYKELADWGWMLGFEGRLSYNDYEFFEGNADERKREEFGGSLMVAAAWPLNLRTRFGFSGGVQRSFEPSRTKVQRCETVEASESLEACKELPLGEPAKREGALLRAEFRWATNPLVIAPLVSYDEARDVWGVELPFYFLRSSKAGLTGGFRLGWRSDNDDLVGSVFVTKRLDLLTF